ncbi:hypothetical protein RvY_07156-2 [Ramazzottius varieornatus]|nr:hypothetical protein RvY_07156-2 [Ramazzottius varieornatus]
MQRPKSCLKLTELPSGPPSPAYTIDPHSVVFRLDQPEKLILPLTPTDHPLSKFGTLSSLRGSQSRKPRQRKAVVFEKPSELLLIPDALSVLLPAPPVESEIAPKEPKNPEEPKTVPPVIFQNRFGTMKSKFPRRFAKQSVYINTYLRGGQILSDDRFEAVWYFLPARYQIGHAVLAFETEEHGISITTFYDKLKAFPASILVIRTTNEEVFGAFCSEDWEKRRERKDFDFFGTGETFVFSFSPRSRIYPWIGWTSVYLKQAPPPSCSMYMAGSPNTLMIGGGG